MIARTSHRSALKRRTTNSRTDSGLISPQFVNFVPKPESIRETRTSPRLRKNVRRYVREAPSCGSLRKVVSRYEKPQANRKLGMIESA